MTHRPISSRTWVGLTSIWDVPQAAGQWAVLQLRCCPSKTVEHPKSKSTQPSPLGDGSPCIHQSLLNHSQLTLFNLCSGNWQSFEKKPLKSYFRRSSSTPRWRSWARWRRNRGRTWGTFSRTSSVGCRDQLYKTGLPGKSILGDYFKENRTSRRPFLLLRISFPGRPIFIQLPPVRRECKRQRRAAGAAGAAPVWQNVPGALPLLIYRLSCIIFLYKLWNVIAKEPNKL